MQRRSFEEALSLILKEDPRFPADAYFFLRQALDATIRSLNKPDHGPGRHVSGRELLEGIRQFALQEFGPITLTVLKTWGITRTEDFGDIVFNLVNKGVLGKTEEDRHEDFAAGYDFRAAFEVPFLPASARTAAAEPTTPLERKKRPRRRTQSNA